MLIIIIVIIILVLLLFLVLNRTVKTINKQAETYFIDKLQNFDDLIKAKEEKLAFLNETINKQKNSLKEEFNDKQKEETVVYDIDNLFKSLGYNSTNVLDLKHIIDEKFDIDYVKIINEFIIKLESNNDHINFQNIKAKLNVDNIYKIESLMGDEQDNFIKGLFNDYEYNIYLKFLSEEENRNIDNFLNYLDYKIQEIEPKIYVLVGDKRENYNYLSDKIKTVYDEKIYKGIKIKYKNKIYDYSISEGSGIV